MMTQFQFLGVESILINKYIFYSERNSMGKYVFDTTELCSVINEYKTSNDYTILNQITQEIFFICNQGRRPWSLEAENLFLALLPIGYKVLSFLRDKEKTTNELYAFLNPLEITSRLEHEIDHLERTIKDEEIAKLSILEILYQLIHIYLKIFDYWVIDFSQMVNLPDMQSMEYLLESRNDVEFTDLLTSFAKTKDPNVKKILISFTNDNEPQVSSLALKLLDMHY